MPGHVNLGDDRDVPISGVFDDVANLVLCVEAAVPFAVAHRLIAIGADLGEFRIFLDLDAPPLVFGRCQ